MPAAVDLCGQRFGKLVAVKRLSKPSRWICRCDCGGEIVTQARSLRSGNTQSCGCLRKESNTKHGHGRRQNQSSTYCSWYAMLQRCNNPKNRSYRHYGGRGILVCQRWLSFENFLEDMGERPDGMTIDREDNDRGYEPENCRWSTTKEQNRNRNSNRMVTVDGITKCLADWADESPVSYWAIKQRLRRGWSPRDAVFEEKR